MTQAYYVLMHMVGGHTMIDNDHSMTGTMITNNMNMNMTQHRAQTRKR